jgi:hypothetical protein
METICDEFVQRQYREEIQAGVLKSKVTAEVQKQKTKVETQEAAMS